MTDKQLEFVAGLISASVFWAYCFMAWKQTDGDGVVLFYLGIALVVALVCLGFITQPEKPHG